MKKVLVLLLCGAMLLMLAACSSDGSLSPEQYKSQLEEHFTTYAEASEQVGNALQKFDFDAVQAASKTAVAEIDAICALKAPAEYADKHAELLKDADESKAYWTNAARFCELSNKADDLSDAESDEYMELADKLQSTSGVMAFAYNIAAIIG
ncbi:MAG: hypothetical protein J1E39_09120 [Eubacterium sp.]|nr:hypothetical protein [Eubacterium sp.]